MKQLMSPLCAALLLAGSTAFLCVDAPLAFAAPEAVQQVMPKAVQTAEYTDAEGNSIKVITFEDGSVAASINGGAYIVGAEASRSLADHGVTLSVSPNGQLVGQNLAANTRVKQAARPVTRSEANSVVTAPQGSVAAAPSLAPVLPANIVVGGGMQTQHAISATKGEATTENTNNYATGRPVSR